MKKPKKTNEKSGQVAGMFGRNPRISKKQAGKKLNEEGRLSPLDAIQDVLEHSHALYKAELAKGDLADPEKIAELGKSVLEMGAAQLPYRHARLSPVEPLVPTTNKIIRVPLQHFQSVEDWASVYCTPVAKLDELERNRDLEKQLLAHVADGKPN